MKPPFTILFTLTVSLFLIGCIGVVEPLPSKSPVPRLPTTVPTRESAKTPTAVPQNPLPPTPTRTPIPTHEPTTVPTAEPSLPKVPIKIDSEAPGEIARGNPNRPQVALTFDAGASAEPVPKILATLRAHKLRCTFFITGEWAEKNPDLLRQIVADGHELGNHSYSHPDFTKLSEQQMVEELNRTELIVQRITGHSTKPFFRPPFGSRNGRVIRIVAEAGYRTVYWTLDSGDWVTGAVPSSVLQRVVNGVQSGSIVVSHMGSQATADVLDDIVKGIQSKGFSIVPISQIVAP